MVKMASFLFGRAKPWADYAFVVLRLVIGIIWINAVIPRWNTLAAGKPLANGLVSTLFGPGMVSSLTLFFTILETLGAIAFILGLLTRLAAVWGVIEFAIIATTNFISRRAIDINDVLMAGSLVLLLHGSFRLSLDGIIAKKKS